MSRMHQDDGHIPFQQVEPGFPGFPGALHGRMGNPDLGQPIGQGEQVDDHGPEFFEFDDAVRMLAGGSGVIRQAVTLLLWTSSPAHWVKMTSMRHLRRLVGLAGYPHLRRYLACFAADGPLATVPGASRYPRPLMFQAHGTRA